MTYKIEFVQATPDTHYFAAIPQQEEDDAFVLCGDTEQEARDFAARCGYNIIN